MSYEQLMQDYTKNGVALLKNVFSAKEMMALKRAGIMALTQVDQISRAGYPHSPVEMTGDINRQSPALLFWPALVNMELNHFRTDKRLSSVVTSILGKEVKQLNNQFYFRLPGDSDSFAWHQDIMFRHPRSDYPGIIEANAYLQTAIIVDPMNASNGGIQFIFGSHKFGDLDLVPANYVGLRGFKPKNIHEKISGLPIKIFDAEPGDLLIWSSLTVHGSEPNETANTRMYYMNGFASSRHVKPWPTYTKDGRVIEIISKEIP